MTTPAIQQPAPGGATIDIPEDGFGSLYVFALDPPTPAKLGPRGVGVLPTLLGFPDLDPDFGEIVSAARLGTTSLPDYIEQTYGVPVAGTDAAALTEAQGRLAVVRRRAFGDGPKTLTLSPGIWYLLTLDAPVRPDPAPVVTEVAPAPPAKGNGSMILILVGLTSFVVTLLLVLMLVL